MKFVLAFDSFKGCLSSAEVETVTESSILGIFPDAEVVKLPVADGGEGTVQAVVDSLGGTLVTAEVSDPLGRRIVSEYGIVRDLAVIEVASACGLTLLASSERNPLLTSTRGVGELILDALHRGCRRFLVGLGGSATNDGGKGMIDSLFEVGELKVSDGACGIPGTEFTVACDVDTPFIGPCGATRIFAPQKGADAQAVEILEKRLTDYSSDILQITGVDVRSMPGAGAAGGLGGAFRAFLGARLCPGADMVLDVVGFDSAVKGADLVFTGEGRSDYQTPKGKTPSGVLKRSRKQGIPVALLSGSIDICPELESMGFATMEASTPAGMNIKEALEPEVAKRNIFNAVKSVLTRL